MTDSPHPFWDHVRELRRCLLLALAGWLTASVLAFNFSSRALDFLLRPPVERLIFTSPAEPFLAYLKLSFILGFIVAFPWVLYQAWRFIGVALRPKERRIFWELLPVSYGLFLAGCAIGLWGVCPVAMRFLLSFSDARLVPFITLGSYLSFVGMICLGLGLFFQFPIVMAVAAQLGLVGLESLSGCRRYVVLGLLIAAALISSGPIDQLLIAVPAYVLFELTLLALRLKAAGSRPA